MATADLWRMAPSDYLAAVRGLRDFVGTDRRAQGEPVVVFGVSQNRTRAEAMGQWCEANEIPARVVHTPAVHFIELYDEAEAVMFKFRWA